MRPEHRQQRRGRRNRQILRNVGMEEVIMPSARVDVEPWGDDEDDFWIPGLYCFVTVTFIWEDEKQGKDQV